MVRDFTEATKEKLSKEIDDINKKTWGPITDAIGDAFMYAGKWIGVLSLYDDMSNVQTYHRNVLDMTNMTKKELNDIFDTVYDIDSQYKQNFVELNKNATVYNLKIQLLYSIIQPNFTICDAKTIRSMVDKYNKALKNIGEKINKNFETEVDWASKEAVLDASKGFISSAIKLYIETSLLATGLIKNITTKSHLKIFSDEWSLVDNVYATGSNLVGLVILGLGYTISTITGDKQTKRFAIRDVEQYCGVTGLTEALEAEEKREGKNLITSFMLWVSKIGDRSSTAAELFTDAKEFIKNPSKLIDWKFGFKDDIGELNKVDMADKYKKDYEDWQSLYKKIGKDSRYLLKKNIDKLYKYLEPLWDLWDGDIDALKEEIAKKITEGSQKWFKFLGDICDIAED